MPKMYNRQLVADWTKKERSEGFVLFLSRAANEPIQTGLSKML